MCVCACVCVCILAHSSIDFDIFVSHKEQFCNGTEVYTDRLMNGVYFQYITNNSSWITVDIYNSRLHIIFCNCFVINNVGSNHQRVRKCTRISVK